MLFRCDKCEERKDETEFHFKNKYLNKRRRICKVCWKKYHKKHYEKNKEKYKAQAKQRKIRNSKFVYEYLERHPCVDCKEGDPVVLEFDHISGDKTLAVSTMARNGVSIETLAREIDKCEIRCANCHRRKTAKQFSWHKYLN